MSRPVRLATGRYRRTPSGSWLPEKSQQRGAQAPTGLEMMAEIGRWVAIVLVIWGGLVLIAGT